VEHPNTGHDLPLDDPQWVVGQVCDAVVRWEQGLV
jgi:hypothetical protein